MIFLCENLTLAQDLKIIDRPVVWDSTRKALSLEYMRERHGLVAQEPSITPKVIVTHWTAIATLEGSFGAFREAKLPSFRKELKNASALNVGIHFLVDKDGTVYRLMPETAFARHVIGLNYCSIGIENVGDGTKSPLTEAQLTANENLIKYLAKKYKTIEYLIGHHEYLLMKNTSLWKETDSNYQTIKNDPGNEFMQKLRDRLKALKLKGVQ